MKTCIRAKSRLQDETGTVWFEDQNRKWRANNPLQAEVHDCEKEKWEQLGRKTQIALAVAFAARFRRMSGIDGGYEAKNLEEKELGLIRKEAWIDGFLRRWYLYIPQKVRDHPEQKFPAVFAVHGFASDGKAYAESTNWIHTADERGFILVFPCGYPTYRTDPDRRMKRFTAVPIWNTGTEHEPEAPDDLNFMKTVFLELEATGQLDTTRVYATGHSNGARMVQYMMRWMPDYFAAFATIGSMEGIVARRLPMPDETIRPCWFFMGSNDLGDRDRLEAGNSNDLTVRNVCVVNRADFENRKTYCCGRYCHSVMYSEKKEPLVRFTGVKELYHSVLPEMNEMIYDEFFCKFARKNGTLQYLG